MRGWSTEATGQWRNSAAARGCSTRVGINGGNGVSNVAGLSTAENELPNGIEIRVSR